jgi:ADP-ribosylglycohydrolase/predicted enzyme related to lactoylglutathione lyase
MRTLGQEKLTGALLAAAAGDALGWPFEDRSSRINPGASHESIGYDDITFQDWDRRTGNRFQSYREKILAGSYSDDTQLLLATQRSLLSLHDEGWQYWLSRIELPFWLCYERGAVGATKRAAQAWLHGSAPWRTAKLVDSYRNAGGNGAAMRILPHAIRHAESSNYIQTFDEVVANSVCTHGHPRAILGALIYGYAAWYSARLRNTLDYGELLVALLDNSDEWGQFPTRENIFVDWIHSYEESSLTALKSLWKSTVNEITHLLKLAQRGIQMGALSTGLEVLEEMGVFNSKIGGSGTITAAASIFLASRYAVSPLQGLAVAATLKRADTDTIASMVGGLLGTLHGSDWLGHLALKVQDSEYFKRLSSDSVSKPDKIRIVSESNLKELRNTLEHSAESMTIDLPDGRVGRFVSKSTCATVSGNFDFSLYQIKTLDGQSLYVSGAKTKKPQVSPVRVSARLDRLGLENAIVSDSKIGFKVFVHDLERAKSFYAGILGLRIEKESSRTLTVGGMISLVLNKTKRASSKSKVGLNSIICLKVSNLVILREKLKGTKIKIIEEEEASPTYPHFYIRDPSGNLIEIFGQND